MKLLNVIERQWEILCLDFFYNLFKSIYLKPFVNQLLSGTIGGILTIYKIILAMVCYIKIDWIKQTKFGQSEGILNLSETKMSILVEDIPVNIPSKFDFNWARFSGE